jgi:hypothetical protein
LPGSAYCWMHPSDTQTTATPTAQPLRSKIKEEVARWAPTVIQLLAKAIEISIDHIAKGRTIGLEKERLRARCRQARDLMEDIRRLEARARRSGAARDSMLMRDYLAMRGKVEALSQARLRNHR